MSRFTKEEKTALIFLLAALFAGSAVMYCKKIFPRYPEILELKESKYNHAKKININKAAEKELTRIKGVGSVLAARIILYRKQNGDFRKTEEIKNIKGIGPKTYEKIKDSLTLE